MSDQLRLFIEDKPRYAIVPRQYQWDCHSKCFELWQKGLTGVLARQATGTGKTITACIVMDTWLQQSPSHRAMVVSYEKQLVWQFAQEVEDVLRIKPAIEMEKEEIDPDGDMPQIVVASRQSLAQQPLADEAQRAKLREFGIEEFGLLTKHRAKYLIQAARKGVSRLQIQEEVSIFQQDYKCNQRTRSVSRLYKFDHELHWLVIYDEAHKHAYKLTTVQHIVDWFSQNPRYRALGLTATPKRYDNVSIGHRMFPGIAIDFPLWSPVATNAVDEGWAVPYRQRYVQVKSVDFVAIKQLAGTSQTKWDSIVGKALERELATLCDPTLNMVGNRKTLVFSPTVQIAKEVTGYINARRKCQCMFCNHIQWWPMEVIEQGLAECRSPDCHYKITTSDICTAEGETQSKVVWGEVAPRTRKEIYDQFERGEFQFLSVCGLCREGYNCPSIQAVAIFRPVSKAASSLAEQMKGRGCRPLRGVVDGLSTPEERRKAIAESDKPYCLIVDLTGVTGLGDCPSTLSIYAEGMADEVKERAQRLIEAGEDDVLKALEDAQKQLEEEKAAEEEARRQRIEAIEAEAQRRAAAGAITDYTEHERGHGGSRPLSIASEKQIHFLRFLGIEFVGWEPSIKQARQAITLIKERGLTVEQAAHALGLNDDDWERVPASNRQKFFMTKRGIPWSPQMTGYEASLAIDRHTKGGPSTYNAISRIKTCRTGDELTALGKQLSAYKQYYSAAEWQQIISAGQQRRTVLEGR